MMAATTTTGLRGGLDVVDSIFDVVVVGGGIAGVGGGNGDVVDVF